MEPLKGIKVIELASVLAGPAVGMFFSELGAEVIKIENAPAGGDATRTWKVAGEDPEATVSAYFSAINYHKKYKMVNLKNLDERDEIYALIKTADVVISNFKTGDDIKFGMEYDRLKELNPKLIYAHLRGFDSQEMRTGYDVVLQAEVGFMSMNGTKQSGPVKFPVAIIDLLAAQQLRQGLMLALWQREKTGNGCMVETSLEASGIAALVNQASAYLMLGKVPTTAGSEHPGIAPYGDTFQCKDGKDIVLAVGTDKQFRHLCQILGDESIADNPLYMHNPERVINRDNMVRVLAELFAKHQRDSLLENLIQAEVPAGAIRNLQEVFESPFAQSMVLEETIEGVATKRVKTVAFRIRE
jgi:crotonobetainyl-CoA:carnitine CoA-transferase CaiB-like acyl-CoA transferase